MVVKAWTRRFRHFLGNLPHDSEEQTMSEKKTVAVVLNDVEANKTDKVDEQQKVFAAVEQLNNKMTASLLNMAEQSVQKIGDAMSTAISGIQMAFTVAGMKYRDEVLDQVLGQIQKQRAEIEAKMKGAKGRLLAHYQKQLTALDMREDQALSQLAPSASDEPVKSIADKG